MDTRRALIFLAVMVVMVIVVMVIALQPQPSCCTPPPDIGLTASAIMATNHAVETYIEETAAKSTVYPYEPTLYAERRQQERNLQTAAGPAEYAAFFATEGALIATYQGTVVPTSTDLPTVTATISTIASSPCAWSWATQDLPDVTSRAAEILQNAEIVTSDLRVSAYGESCWDGSSNSGHFAAMTTDFYLTMDVDDLTDATLAAKLIASYEALNGLSDLPAKPGYLDITFQAAGEEKHIRTMFSQIQVALDENLTGSALILAISSH